MTRDEQKSLDKLAELYSKNSMQIEEFTGTITQLVNNINAKVDQKHTPIQLESDILQATQKAVVDSIDKCLTAYGSPLQKLIVEVVESHSVQLKQIISDSFNLVIQKDEFKQSIINAFSHKVARTIISNNEGLFDKVSNQLKQDQVFRSKLTLAVSNVVEECMKPSGPKFV